MTECYTDRDSTVCYSETEAKESKMNRVSKLAIAGVASAFLFSFVAISNLNHDVNNTLGNKVAYLNNRVNNDITPKVNRMIERAY
ncbi:MAG: hypothetical protein IAF58_00145 [Leptolyngbya sp.]|nr:hypothetical protein [Candidatus Melainabacteria bacterium]